jgi:hypothetical protein
LFELPGREGRWSLEFWERPQSQRAPAKSFEEAVIRIYRFSRVEADGTCSLSAMTQQDSDGQFIDKSTRPLSKVFGLLSLQGADPSDGPAAEKAWMIIQSLDYPGSERGGVFAIPLAADGVRLMIEAADWLTYSGC